MGAKYVGAIILLLTITSAYGKSAKCPGNLQTNALMVHPVTTKYYICLESGFLTEMMCPQGTEFDSHRSVCMPTASHVSNNVDVHVTKGKDELNGNIVTIGPMIPNKPCDVETTPCPCPTTTPCPCPTTTPCSEDTPPTTTSTSTKQTTSTTTTTTTSTTPTTSTTATISTTTTISNTTTTTTTKCPPSCEEGEEETDPPIYTTTPIPEDDCADGTIDVTGPIVTTPLPDC